MIDQNLKKIDLKKDDHYALVIDSKSITFILDKSANLRDKFFKLSKACGSVLGCRATPLQKAYIVRYYFT